MKQAAIKASTVVSTKGQVILPQAIRKRRQWSAGTRLIVEDTPEGVLLKTGPFFPPSKPEEAFGCLRTSGPAKTLEEMDAAIMEEVKRRHARGRY
jgi:AbrB family looped-hinge helix DNA binding protein